MRHSWFVLSVLAALVTTMPGAAQAQAGGASKELSAARALANAGFQLYEQGEYATAFDRFARAEEIYHAPPHLLYMARVQAKLGKLVEASALYGQLVAESMDEQTPEPFREAQAEARAELEQLGGTIPSLQITVTGPQAGEATVTIDGQPVDTTALDQPVSVNPGEHLLQMQLDGYESGSQTITVDPGEQGQSVELSLGPALAGDQGEAPATADTSEEPSILPPIIVIGVGAAGLAVGAITGVLTLNDAAELKDRCPTNPCPPDNQSLIDSVNTLGTVSTVGFVVGGAAAGAGLLWLLLQGGDDGSEASEEAVGSKVDVMVGAGWFGVRTTF